MHHASRTPGADLTPKSCKVGFDPFMAVDWEVGIASIGHDGGCARNIMKMTVDTRNNGFIGMLPEFLDRLRHLFMTLAGINGNNSARPADEGLIRQAIPHVAPSVFPNRIKPFL